LKDPPAAIVGATVNAVELLYLKDAPEATEMPDDWLMSPVPLTSSVPAETVVAPV
jgi:hypothetical protein